MLNISNGSGHAPGADMEQTAEALNRLTNNIIGCAIEVHRALGAGLLESAYQHCLANEFRQAGLQFDMQRELPLDYKGERVDCAYRLDFLIENAVVLEVKSVSGFEPIHTAQMLTYLRLTGCRVGLLMNFNTRVLKDGLKRIVREFPEFTAEAAKIAKI